MVKQVLLQGKPAYKIAAKVIAKGRKADLYDLEGDHVWIPYSVSRYNADSKTVLVLDWYYHKEIIGLDNSKDFCFDN